MSEIQEIVTLEAGGEIWHAWTRASVSYSAKQAVRAFAFTLVDAVPFVTGWKFMPGEKCTVKANGDLVLEGYVNVNNPSFDKASHKVEISGKSKAQDTVDSSAQHETSQFRNKTILEIANALDEQGVGFSTDQSLKKIKLFRLNPAETVFDAVERIARKQELILMGQPDGSIKITKGGKSRVHTALVEGQNILGGSATFSDENRHSEYKVKGQSSLGTNLKGSIRIEAKAKDPQIKRNRPKIITPETDITPKDAKERAKKHRDRQQGESVRASIRVQGWRDENGVLWQANTLIYVQCPTLKLDMDLLIESVNLTQDQNGTLAQLALVHPKALGSDAKTGSKTDNNWKYDPGKDEAEEDEDSSDE